MAQPVRFAAALALGLGLPFAALAADGIEITHPFARVRPGAMTAAVYMTIENHGTGNDKLMSVTTDAASMAEVHESKVDANGMASMNAVDGGLAIPGQGTTELKEGAGHIMLMGLAHRLKTGDKVTLMLTFAQAGKVTIEVPVNP